MPWFYLNSQNPLLQLQASREAICILYICCPNHRMYRTHGVKAISTSTIKTYLPSLVPDRLAEEASYSSPGRTAGIWNVLCL